MKLGLYDPDGALVDSRDLDGDGRVIGEPLSASEGQWLYLFTPADQTLQPIGNGALKVSRVSRASNTRIPSEIPFAPQPFSDWECV